MGSVQQDSLGDDDPKGRGDHEDRSAAAGVRLNQIARKFANYEDFLDSRVTETDMFYLEDRSIARTIKELSFHGNSEEITREQFDEKKSELAGVKKTEELKSGLKYLYTDRDVFLLELARREDANLSGRLVSVLYIRDRNAKGQEVSSYIDYAQRLREDNFENFFAGRQRLTSKTSDLSYFNWDTKVTHSNNSPNFDVVFHGHGGLRLKCRKDHRIIHLNPNRQVADTNIEDTTRTLIRSRNYAQVVFFDHFIRLWANDEDLPHSQEKLLTGKDRVNEPGLDLYDNVTAAIYEDDLLEIAREALDGNLHQEHNFEWTPAEILAEHDQLGHGSSEPTSDPHPPHSKFLETSVLGTMKDLYDAHKNDVSFETLGNFTFIEMIEQLDRLLPEKTKTRADPEVLTIGQGTATVKGKMSDQNLQLATVDVEEIVENDGKILANSKPVAPTSQEDLAGTLMVPSVATSHEDPAGTLMVPSVATSQEDPGGTPTFLSVADSVASIISGLQHHKRVESSPAGSFPTRTSEKDPFDPISHIKTIKALYPQRSRGSDEVLSQPKSVG